MAHTSTDGRSYSGDPAQGLAGIGLLMQQDGGPQSKVFVKHIVPNGPCSRDGVVQVGDYVVGVNGQPMVGFPVADIRERIMGAFGSSVRVAFERSSTGEVFERTITRGTVQSITGSVATTSQQDQGYYMSRSLDGRALSLSTSGIPASAMTNDSEVTKLKSRIAELESELTMCRDELGRTRMLLDQDKDNSKNLVNRLDTVQRKHDEQIMEMQRMLHQREQSCRELEIQVASSSAREEEFHVAFQRAKEKTEAREMYFADLKRKFEDMQNNFDKDLARERESKMELERARFTAEQNLEKMKQELDSFKEMERMRREKEEGVRKLLHESEAKLVEARAMEEKVRAQAQSIHLLFGQWQKDFFMNKSKEEAELEQYFLA